MAFGLQPNFHEPKSSDTTSAPKESVPANVSPVADLLKKKLKSPRQPQALASAIARSKRAHQTKRRYG